MKLQLLFELDTGDLAVKGVTPGAFRQLACESWTRLAEAALRKALEGVGEVRLTGVRRCEDT